MEVQPVEVMRCGVIFGQVAEQVQGAIGQARRASSVRWAGRPSERFQVQLAELAGRMQVVAVSHDSACDVLLRYSRALEPVRELALRSEALRLEADSLVLLREMAPYVDPVDLRLQEADLRARAGSLLQEAQLREYDASRLCARQLRELAQDAPQVRGAALNRFASEGVVGFGQGVKGLGVLVADLVRSVPGVGSADSRDQARDALWEQAKVLAQPWTMVEQLLDELTGEHPGYVVGSLASAVVVRVPPVSKTSRLFGTYDRMPAEVLTALIVRAGGEPRDLTRVNGWVWARAQQTFRDEMRRLKSVPAPTLQQLIDGKLDLLHQEALGGHTLYKHVGRDVAFLRKRQLAETRGRREPSQASSFLDEAEAQMLIQRALQLEGNQARLRDFELSDRKDISLVAPAQGHGVLVASTGAVLPTASVFVELRRAPDGSVRVERAFLQ